MIELVQQTVQQALSSEVFTGVAFGGAALSVFGFLLYQARSLPIYAWGFIESQFKLTLTVMNDEPAFHLVDLWLAQHPISRKARRLTTLSSWSEDTEKNEHTLTIGGGSHLMWVDSRPWIVHRQMPSTAPQGESASASVNLKKPLQVITFSTYGRAPKPLFDLMSEIESVAERKDTVPVYIWNGYFKLVGRKAKRALSTIYCADGLKEAVLYDIRTFLSRKQWYADRGVPWRRGVMLGGPPGTGKTSLIFAVASELNRPLYIINPATLEDDNELQSALNSARHGIVVIEDIDAIEKSANRKGGEKKAGKEASAEGITLSGLLNAIDGLASAEGRILFLTSNHPEDLDDALTRHGRVDKRFTLDRADAVTAAKMHQAYFPANDAGEFLSTVSFPVSQAELQNKLMELSEVRGA